MEMSAARYQCENKINIEDSEGQLIGIRLDCSQHKFSLKCSATFYIVVVEFSVWFFFFLNKYLGLNSLSKLTNSNSANFCFLEERILGGMITYTF